jgi:hypothetical protein
MSKIWKPFMVDDLFNPPNKIEGYISNEYTNFYGALRITKVNGIEIQPQFIWATPKMHYPFSTNSKYERIYHSLPKKIDQINIYEKLDGINILAYSYADATGKRYQTFKTRLTPVVTNTDMVDFYDLLNEVLTPTLRSIPEVLSGEFAYSFELYGYKNPITIVYEQPIALKQLFKVEQKSGAIHIPSVKPIQSLTSCEDVQKLYELLRNEAQNKNKMIEDDKIIGIEGYMFYVLHDGMWTQYKLKPDMIEQIHWSWNTSGIPPIAIRNTVLNSLENGELNLEFIKELLLEEFSKDEIELSIVRIEKIINDVRTTIEFENSVKKTFADLGLQSTEKGEVLRLMSKHFPKVLMSKVYIALRKFDYIKE